MFPGTMRFAFFNKGFTIPESYRDPGVLFLLRGKARVSIGNDKAELGVSDYITINSYEHFSVDMVEDTLVGALVISYEGAHTYLDLAHYDIRCASSMENGEVRERIRRRLMRLFAGYANTDNEEAATVAAAFYELLYDIRMNCMVLKTGMRSDRKKTGIPAEITIRRYLEEHYREKVSLKDLSGETYFSEAYLSRFIKGRFGKNFGKLLTDIRLTHARQLLSEENVSILHVALESGFADTAALNKAFAAEYGVTPSEYRKQTKKVNVRTEQQMEEHSELDRKVRDFFRREGAEPSDTELSDAEPYISGIRLEGNELYSVCTEFMEDPVLGIIQSTDDMEEERVILESAY